MSIQVFLNEFDKHLFKTKTYGTTMSDDVLTHQLLKSANFSTHHEELTKATTHKRLYGTSQILNILTNWRIYCLRLGTQRF